MITCKIRWTSWPILQNIYVRYLLLSSSNQDSWPGGPEVSSYPSRCPDQIDRPHRPRCASLQSDQGIPDFSLGAKHGRITPDFGHTGLGWGDCVELDEAFESYVNQHSRLWEWKHVPQLRFEYVLFYPVIPQNTPWPVRFPKFVSMFGCVRTEALAVVAREPKIHVAFAGGAIWLLNKGSSGVEIGPGELFGFNTGTYIEVQSGM